MAIQKINLGTEPLGEGGDTYRSANTKINENFNNPDHAASRLVGTTIGKIPKVDDTNVGLGGWGIGSSTLALQTKKTPQNVRNLETGVYSYSDEFSVATGAPIGVMGLHFGWFNTADAGRDAVGITFDRGTRRWASYEMRTAETTPTLHTFYTTSNTNKGTNGVLSSKSPVTHLYHDRVEHTGDEKELQTIKFVKQGVGDYLIKNTTGLAQEGWYIVIPHDANGNPLIAVEYDDKDGDVNVRTYKRKFDYEQAKVVADHDNPMDIPETRWIDLRFNDDPSLYEDEVTEHTKPEEEPIVEEAVEPEVVREPSEESK